MYHLSLSLLQLYTEHTIHSPMYILVDDYGLLVFLIVLIGLVITIVALFWLCMFIHGQVPLQALHLTYPFMKTPWQGAQTTIYCAVAEELEGVSGRYFADCRDNGMMTQATTDEAVERLWELSCQWSGLSNN